jgi:hypothetical protein
VLALPVLGAFGVTPVGAFRMFTDPIRYRIQIAAALDDGAALEVPVAPLRPHVTRDTWRVLNGSHDFRVGETQARLLGGALGDLGELVCRLDPRRRRVWVRMDTRDVRDRPLPARSIEVECR